MIPRLIENLPSEYLSTHPSVSRWRLAGAFLLVLLLACGPTPQAPEQPQERAKNVLILCVDALRADHLGTYGYERQLSPEIDRLAASGTVFENAYSQGTWTLPSVSSLFLSQ